MNNLFALLGIQAWKPVLAALVLPPVPWLLLILVATLAVRVRRWFGWLLMLWALAGLWLSSTTAVAEWWQHVLLAPSDALTSDQMAEIKHRVAARQKVAIVVLGGGMETFAPEYGMSNLASPSLERLRYGVWLARGTGAGLAFSGGLGYATRDTGVSEAEVAARVAAREFGLPLHWMEAASRDTRENGLYTLNLLRSEKVTDIVLVTHAWHMPRALRAFADAAVKTEMPVRLIPAPIGLAPRLDRPVLRWLPSSEGFSLSRQVWREKIGWWMGS